MRAVLVVAALALCMQARAGVAVLERMEITASPASVTLRLSQPVAAQAGSLRDPERIFLDLPGTTLGPEARSAMSGAGPVLRVRSAQRDPSNVRVVLDLRDRSAYFLRSEGNSVTITLAARDATNDTVAPPEPAPAPDRETRLSPSADRIRRRLFLDYP